MKNLLYLLLISVLAIAGTACGGDDDDGPSGADCNSLQFSAEFQDEINAITAAATAFGNDPSQANCDALKAAYNSYLDELEDWEDCAIFYNQETEWRDAIDSTRAAVDTIC